MNRWQITAQKPSQLRENEHIVVRLDLPNYSEAWLQMGKLIDDGWHVIDGPEPLPDGPLIAVLEAGLGSAA